MILEAAIGASGAVAAAWLTSRGVRKEIRTNHGKRAGEYLEMIGPLATKVEDVAADTKAFVQLLAAHEAHDEDNFRRLRRQVEALAVERRLHD